MMKYFLSIVVVLMLVIACKKDKVATTPKLSLKSISNNRLALREPLSLILGFTDKEGDLDSLYMIRQRLNKKGPLSINGRLPLPATSKETEGEIGLRLDYDGDLLVGITPIGSSNFDPDTLRLKFVLLDKKKNKSDTLVIDDIIAARR
ncbi:MAG: hypothetical protein JWP88_956 [Flaviaesturariibacter sp.]|nr:hypothetical protein [Flaviaesturariibacter sp.]